MIHDDDVPQRVLCNLDQCDHGLDESGACDWQPEPWEIPLSGRGLTRTEADEDRFIRATARRDHVFVAGSVVHVDDLPTGDEL